MLHQNRSSAVQYLDLCRVYKETNPVVSRMLRESALKALVSPQWFDTNEHLITRNEYIERNAKPQDRYSELFLFLKGAQLHGFASQKLGGFTPLGGEEYETDHILIACHMVDGPMNYPASYAGRSRAAYRISSLFSQPYWIRVRRQFGTWPLPQVADWLSRPNDEWADLIVRMVRSGETEVIK